MALLYGYGTGSVIESFCYDQVLDLLNQIPNNTTNLIKAEDVRDSVFTLWERISDLSAIVASASITPTTYINPNPTTITAGGISSGTTFPTPKTVQEMFDLLLYPYTLPRLTLTPVTVKEYGQSLSTTLNWIVTKRSNTILSVIIDGFSIIGITGNTQAGTRVVSGAYSLPLPVSTVNNFIMTAYDGTGTASTNVTMTWMNKIYWGSIDLSGLAFPNPDLTLNPSYTTYVTAAVTSLLVRSLDGAGFLTGNELSTIKNKTYTGINGNGKYLIFAWPSTVSGATTPTFTVNGLPNTAFTRVRTAWSFTNGYGIVSSYEVWVSNTAYNSAANIIIS